MNESKKGGRPPKLEEEKKSFRITSAVTKEEYLQIEAYSKKHNFLKSEIIRAFILEKIGVTENFTMGISRDDVEILLKIDNEFSSIKNNLNQIAKGINILVIKYSNTQFLQHKELIETTKRAKELIEKMDIIFDKITRNDSDNK